MTVSELTIRLLGERFTQALVNACAEVATESPSVTADRLASAAKTALPSGTEEQLVNHCVAAAGTELGF
jgi:hypothetical protein